ILAERRGQPIVNGKHLIVFRPEQIETRIEDAPYAVARERHARVDDRDEVPLAPRDAGEADVPRGGRAPFDAEQELVGARTLERRVDRRQSAARARTGPRDERAEFARLRASVTVGIRPSEDVRLRRGGISVSQRGERELMVVAAVAAED